MAAVRIPGKSGILFFDVEAASRAHPASYPVDTGLFVERKAIGA
jgi:hypothetical protein